jgi:hypothetical protein
MTQKLTMKTLSSEIHSLRRRLQELESLLENTRQELRSRIDSMERQPAASAVGGFAVDTETRHQLIAQSAYLRAERRGFSGGSPEQDWLQAEQEINSLLLQRLTETGAAPAGRAEPGNTGPITG